MIPYKGERWTVRDGKVTGTYKNGTTAAYNWTVQQDYQAWLRKTIPNLILAEADDPAYAHLLAR